MLGKSSLEGVHVAIQGAGHVGYHLAKDLVMLGAKVTQSDINPNAIQRCVEEFKVTPISSENIYDIDCDVFSPCALGSTINADTIKRLKAKIIAGSANNQLAHLQNGIMLHEHGILYAPDFVINSGGLIHAAAIYDHGDLQKANAQIYELYDTIFNIFKRAQVEHLASSEVADIIALENLKKKD